MNQESEMQRRFGARVTTTPSAVAETQLFLILGSGAWLAALISGLGGKAVLVGPNWVLAEMGFSRAMALRGTPGVRMVGGVSVDPERMDQFRNMLEAKRGGT